MNSQVQQASKATFLSSQVQNIGNEPALIGMVSACDKDILSVPIVGNNAIFVANVLSKNDPRTSGDFSKQKVIQDDFMDLSKLRFSNATKINNSGFMLGISSNKLEKKIVIRLNKYRRYAN